MDILSKYEQETPKEKRTFSKIQYPPGVGSVGKIIIKLSGGRISDKKQINFIMLTIIIISLGISFIALSGFFVSSSNPTPNLPLPQDLVKQRIAK